MDPSPGGSLVWDDITVGSGLGFNSSSAATSPGQGRVAQTGDLTLSPLGAEQVGPAERPNPNTEQNSATAASAKARSGDEPVASASLREPRFAALGRRLLQWNSGISMGSASRGVSTAASVLRQLDAAAAGQRQLLQASGSGLGSDGGPWPPATAREAANAQAGTYLGATRLLVRRAPLPGPSAQGTIPSSQTLGLDQQQTLLQRLLQSWRGLGQAAPAGLGSGTEAGREAGKAQGAAAAAAGHGEVDVGTSLGAGLGGRVAAAQAAMPPPPWVTLATTAAAVAPGSNMTVDLVFTGARPCMDSSFIDVLMTTLSLAARVANIQHVEYFRGTSVSIAASDDLLSSRPHQEQDTRPKMRCSCTVSYLK